MIRVLLVDDHPLVIDGLRRTLEQQPDMTVIDAVADLAAAEAVLAAKQVDVAIVDIRLPDGSGLELLREGAAAPAFVMLSSFDTPQYQHAALRLGAAGYLLKTAPSDEIVTAVRRVATGGFAFAQRVSRTVAPGHWKQPTGREIDIVRGVMDGRSNDEIGADLGLSRKTVEAYLSRLFHRYGVTTRTELALRAERERWLDIPDGTRAAPRATRRAERAE